MVDKTSTLQDEISYIATILYKRRVAIDNYKEEIISSKNKRCIELRKTEEYAKIDKLLRVDSKNSIIRNMSEFLWCIPKKIIDFSDDVKEKFKDSGCVNTFFSIILGFISVFIGMLLFMDASYLKGAAEVLIPVGIGVVIGILSRLFGLSGYFFKGIVLIIGYLSYGFVFFIKILFPINRIREYIIFHIKNEFKDYKFRYNACSYREDAIDRLISIVYGKYKIKIRVDYCCSCIKPIKHEDILDQNNELEISDKISSLNSNKVLEILDLHFTFKVIPIDVVNKIFNNELNGHLLIELEEKYKFNKWTNLYDKYIQNRQHEELKKLEQERIRVVQTQLEELKKLEQERIRVVQTQHEELKKLEQDRINAINQQTDAINKQTNEISEYTSAVLSEADSLEKLRRDINS